MYLRAAQYGLILSLHCVRNEAGLGTSQTDICYSEFENLNLYHAGQMPTAAEH